MNNKIAKSGAVLSLLIVSSNLFAQTGGSSSSTYIIYALLLIAALLILGAVMMIGDSMVSIKAKELGVEDSVEKLSIFPSAQELFGQRAEGAPSNKKVHFLKKGFDIKLEGEAVYQVDENHAVSRFAVQPKNFIGMSPIPKVVVEVGDEVKAGDHLFFDKKNPDVKYVAPVSGEVVAVNRAEKRSISEVVILADKEIKYRKFGEFDIEKADREQLVNFLLDAGVWPHIRQRPYDIVADPSIKPKAIFITTFDTAPLAPDLDLVVAGREDEFQMGLDILGKLTDGKVHLSVNAKDTDPSVAYTAASGVEVHYFHGPHPAGNVGVQIHHIDAINSGEKVWTLGVQDVCTVGALFIEGIYDAERIIALTGDELSNPRYITTYLGANIGDLVKDNLKNDHVRYISGDVLSGKQKTQDQFLNFFDDQMTVVEEGDEYEAFGWLLPSSPRPSLSPTFVSNLIGTSYKANTNTHGEKRAFVVTGQYEEVMPMDIFPQHIMKSILINDFERMEGLGILELSEEDVALCEFACTSKQPLQELLREGLDLMRDQE